MKEKKQSALSELLEYAGSFKILTYLSLILSALSSVLSLMPFVFLWRIIREVLEVQPDFSRATGIVRNGWMAVLFAVLAALVYVGALVCSHGSAFRTAANMKKALMRHIACLPIGFADEMGSGKLRRIVTEVTGSTETLLAHNLPDMAGAIAMPLCMLVMLFVYDWRYGVACLIPIILSFAAMMRMAGPAMQEDMRLYQNALERMSNEAVEYVRGVPVVKTFGQTVFSFHRFKASIDDYCEFCMHYTRMMRKSMLGYTVLINSAFVFILGVNDVIVSDFGNFFTFVVGRLFAFFVIGVRIYYALVINVSFEFLVCVFIFSRKVFVSSVFGSSRNVAVEKYHAGIIVLAVASAVPEFHSKRSVVLYADVESYGNVIEPVVFSDLGIKRIVFSVSESIIGNLEIFHFIYELTVFAFGCVRRIHIYYINIRFRSVKSLNFNGEIVSRSGCNVYGCRANACRPVFVDDKQRLNVVGVYRFFKSGQSRNCRSGKEIGIFFRIKWSFQDDAPPFLL